MTQVTPKSVLFFLSLLICFFQSAFSQRQNLKFTHLSLDQGLSQSSVHTIVQDKKGFIWVGTQDGLNRFDGYEFKVYKHIPNDQATISDSWVNALYIDKTGNMWVGTSTGLDKFDNRTEKFIHFPLINSKNPSPPENLILSIVETEDSLLWVGTRMGLVCVNLKNNSQKRYLKSDTTGSEFLSNINDLHCDSQNNLWIASTIGLFKKSPTSTIIQKIKFDQKELNKSAPFVSVSSILEDSEGNIWLGSNNNGLIKFDIKLQKWIFFQNSVKDKDIADLGNIFSVVEDRNKNIWIGTLQGELSKFDQANNTFKHYRYNTSNSSGISYDEIRSLYVDRSNILWIGTYGSGVNLYDLKPEKFQHYSNQETDENSANENDVWAILLDHNENLWIGTNGGGLNRISKEGKSKTYKADVNGKHSLRSNRINAIFEDKNGTIWIGTRDFLHIYNAEKDDFSLLKPKNQEVHRTGVWSIFQDSKDNIWIGTNSGLNKYIPSSNKIFYYQEVDSERSSLLGTFIKVIQEDSDGNIWVGTGNGLNKYDPKTDKFTRFVHEQNNPNSLSYNNISALYYDKKGILWIGTSGGLNKYKIRTGEFKLYLERDGLPNNFIYSIIPDENGMLWISTNNGLSKLNPDLLDLPGRDNSKAFRNYDVNDGLQSNEFNRGAGFKSDKGELFFGGINGYNRFFPDDVKDNPNPPQIVITAFKKFDQLFVSDTSITEIKEIKLTHRENVFSFEFAALDYSNPLKNQYAYKMEGFNDGWIYSGTRRYISYTNLNPGDYVFHVKGSNNDGIWNEKGSSIKITIIPPLWRTTAAYILYIMFLSFGVYGIISWRTHLHKKEKEILAQRVLEKTVELQKRTFELEQSYEQLRKSQSIVIQSEKMASLGTLVAGIAHEINNPVNFISTSVMPLKRDVHDILQFLAMFLQHYKLKHTYPKSVEIQIEIERLEKEVSQLYETFDMSDMKSEIDSLLKGIETGSVRTTEIVKSLRIFSRSDGKDLKLSDLHEGIDSTLLILSKEYGNRIEVEKIYGNIPQVECLPGQLNQVFMNILMNAVQAIEGNGKIRIETKVEDHYVILSVKDSGKGITKEVQSKIFDPFFTTKDVGKGTGLGLSISYGIIQKHGGNIHVFSEPGSGTEFQIMIPVHQSEAYSRVI